MEDLFKDGANDDFQLPIRWNVKEISGKNEANGYIVQYMNIQSSNRCISSAHYYEAWLVEDGLISNEDTGTLWDDVWDVPYSYLDKDINQISVTFSSIIYWIPKDSENFDCIMGWNRHEAPEAGFLRATHFVDWDIEKFFVCRRYYKTKRIFKNDL